MKREWRVFAWKIAAVVALALFVHWAMTLFLGAPVGYVVPAILGVGALYIVLFDRTPLPEGSMLKRGVALLLGAFAVWLAVPESGGTGIQWQPFSNDLLEAARRGGRPVMIEFTVENCGPCLAMQKKVFPRAEVAAAAEPFLALKADLTRGDDEAIRLSDSFNIEAFPTFVFIGADGKERVNLRLVGYEPAEFFVQRLQQAR